MSVGEQLDAKMSEFDTRLQVLEQAPSLAGLQAEVNGIKALLQAIYDLFIETYEAAPDKETTETP